MNCRDAQERMLAARDGAIPDTERSLLEGHLSECVSCSRMRDAMNAGTSAFRESAHAAELPDVAGEWLEIRSRIRQPAPAAARRLSLAPLIGVPVAVAAAVAIAFFAMPGWFGPGGARATTLEARAEFVEVPGTGAATVVFVDEPSGWLVVWAVAPQGEAGG